MFKLEFQFKNEWGAKRRVFDTALRNYLTEALLFWHSEFLPRHFATRVEVDSRYPGAYQRRAGGTTFTGRDGKRKYFNPYDREKQNRYGHARLLEFSGAMRRQVTSSIRIVGSARNLRGVMRGNNRALNFSGHRTSTGGSYPDLRAELTVVNEQETGILAKQIQGKLVAFFNGDEVGKYS